MSSSSVIVAGNYVVGDAVAIKGLDASFEKSGGIVWFALYTHPPISIIYIFTCQQT